MDPMQAELLRLYHDLDEELARLGWTCKACGECCRFSEHGQTLYCTGVEADYLLGSETPKSATEELCAFLVNGTCSRRSRRTICCRTYYCSLVGAGAMEKVTERYLSRLKEIYDRAGQGWDYRSLAKHINDRNASDSKD
jgi:hypothetical protein